VLGSLTEKKAWERGSNTLLSQPAGDNTERQRIESQAGTRLKREEVKEESTWNNGSPKSSDRPEGEGGGVDLSRETEVNRGSWKGREKGR
jgi:hypothetical protein